MLFVVARAFTAAYVMTAVLRELLFAPCSEILSIVCLWSSYPLSRIFCENSMQQFLFMMPSWLEKVLSSPHAMIKSIWIWSLETRHTRACWKTNSQEQWKLILYQRAVYISHLTKPVESRLTRKSSIFLSKFCLNFCSLSLNIIYQKKLVLPGREDSDYF